MHYTIYRVDTPPPLTPDGAATGWAAADTAEIAHFHPRTGDHRPQTFVRLLADARNLYLQFLVRDRYVRSVRTEFQDNVCQDSCVEFFVRPGTEGPYFNFEMNAGGTLLASCLWDWKRSPRGFADCRRLTPEQGEQVRIVSSLPRVVEPEITEPLTWGLCAHIPLAVMEAQLGPLSTEPGVEWQGNFYKCGSDLSHPHWACWSPIEEELNFHQPRYFGRLTFADAAHASPETGE